MIWYSVIFAAILYSMFVWSSDILASLFINVVILVYLDVWHVPTAIEAAPSTLAPYPGKGRNYNEEYCYQFSQQVRFIGLQYSIF